MTTAPASSSAPVVRDLEIVNKRGLHARASAKFVKAVSAHDVCVQVEKDGISVGGASIMGLMMLAASPGCCIRVTATGPDAHKVMAQLEALIAGRFGEEA